MRTLAEPRHASRPKAFSFLWPLLSLPLPPLSKPAHSPKRNLMCNPFHQLFQESKRHRWLPVRTPGIDHISYKFELWSFEILWLKIFMKSYCHIELAIKWHPCDNVFHTCFLQPSNSGGTWGSACIFCIFAENQEQENLPQVPN